jgi:hypothetical protein
MISLKGIAVLIVSFIASWAAAKALIPLLKKRGKLEITQRQVISVLLGERSAWWSVVVAALGSFLAYYRWTWSRERFFLGPINHDCQELKGESAS